jgi:hypothetical protein
MLYKYGVLLMIATILRTHEELKVNCNPLKPRPSFVLDSSSPEVVATILAKAEQKFLLNSNTRKLPLKQNGHYLGPLRDYFARLDTQCDHGGNIQYVLQRYNPENDSSLSYAFYPPIEFATTSRRKFTFFFNATSNNMAFTETLDEAHEKITWLHVYFNSNKHFYITLGALLSEIVAIRTRGDDDTGFYALFFDQQKKKLSINQYAITDNKITHDATIFKTENQQVHLHNDLSHQFDIDINASELYLYYYTIGGNLNKFIYHIPTQSSKIVNFEPAIFHAINHSKEIVYEKMDKDGYKITFNDKNSIITKLNPFNIIFSRSGKFGAAFFETAEEALTVVFNPTNFAVLGYCMIPYVKVTDCVYTGNEKFLHIRHTNKINQKKEESIIDLRLI